MTELQNTDSQHVLGAMRSGEWLRTQWIARAAFGLGPTPWEPSYALRVKAALTQLERRGLVERRDAAEMRTGEIAGQHIQFSIPRTEWRLVPNTSRSACDLDSR